MRLPPVRTPAALVLASLLGCGLPLLAGAPVLPAWAADETPVIGSEALIGKLIPITGDPISIRTVDLRIEFRRDSSELGEGAEVQLRELGAALTSEALGAAALGVYGHTDASGPADYNRKLSERRAQSVVAFLREHFGIAEARFREVHGYGEARPREDLPLTAAAQRRVEIVAFHDQSTEEGGGSEEAADAVASDGSARAIPLPGVVAEVAEEPPSRAREEHESDEESRGSGYLVIE